MIQKSNPIISVVMPVFNREKYLEAAIKSVLEQTYRDFEFIIVNDGSTDSSLEIIQKYERQDDRIVVVNQPNEGFPYSINSGLKYVKGKYVAYMDSDDVCMPLRLERQLAFMEEHLDYAAVGSNVLAINEWDWEMHEEIKAEEHQDILNEIFDSGNGLRHPTLFMRQSVLEEINGYDTNCSFWADIDIFLKLAEKGKLGNIQEGLLKYRCHAGGLSQNNITANKHEAIRRMRKINEYRQRYGLPTDYSYEVYIVKGQTKTDRFIYLKNAMLFSFRKGQYSSTLIYVLLALKQSIQCPVPWSYSCRWLLRKMGILSA